MIGQRNESSRLGAKDIVFTLFSYFPSGNLH
jgi:hypothetical protein